MVNLREFSKEKYIHFIGIGGCNMSSLAMLLHNKGYRVKGSDREYSSNLNSLEERGIPISIGQVEENISNNVQLIVYTVAVPKNNPELLKGNSLEIPIIDRGELLGAIMELYPQSIAVSGTHGKTTTSSMIGLMLESSNFDPTITIGGDIPIINSNYKIGKTPYFVAEACEYYESFLHFNPYYGVILNIEEEHTDYFTNKEHIINSFTEFSKKVKKDGVLTICNDNKNIHQMLPKLNRDYITFGIHYTSDYMAENIKWKNGLPSFTVSYKGEYLIDINLHVLGNHNIYNALAAISIGHQIGLSKEQIKKGIEIFHGVHRRLEYKGISNGVHIYDDIACHPNEIKATLDGLRRLAGANEIYIVLKPNSFTRVKDFLNDFVDCFKKNETIIITDIYAARDIDDGTIHSLDLVKNLQENNLNVIYFSAQSDIRNYLNSKLPTGSYLLTIGPKDVYMIGEMLLTKEETTLV